MVTALLPRPARAAGRSGFPTRRAASRPLAAALALAALADAAPAQSGAVGDWDSAPPAWLHVVGTWGPWLLAAVVAALLVRALATHRRYRARGVLGHAELEALHAELMRAEARTSGEILPVVVERSDPHPAADARAALLALLLGTALLGDQLPWTRPEWLLLCQAGLAITGFALARFLPDLRHWLVPPERALAVSEEQAFQEFFRNGLHETRGRTGVLLFVSLLEHRVIVMADTGIASKLPPDAWAGTAQAVLVHVADGRLADGLADGIRQAGELLAAHAPRAPDDANEIPDRIIVRRE